MVRCLTMFRRLFNFASALSLVLCFASCALWIKSYRQPDELHWRRYAQGDETIAMIFSAEGRILLRREHSHNEPVPKRYHRGIDWFHPPSANIECFIGQVKRPNRRAPHYFEAMGLVVAWGPLSPPEDDVVQDAAIVPFRLFFCLSFALPLVWTAKALSRRRFDHNYCPVCGYDLRATPHRCPECGTPAYKKDFACDRS